MNVVGGLQQTLNDYNVNVIHTQTVVWSNLVSLSFISIALSLFFKCRLESFVDLAVLADCEVLEVLRQSAELLRNIEHKPLS